MGLFCHGRRVKARCTDRSDGPNDGIGARDFLLQSVLDQVVVAVVVAGMYDVEVLPAPEEVGEVAFKLVQVGLGPGL